MPTTKYSEELMSKILRLRRQGRTFAEIAVEFEISPSAVHRWVYYGRGGATQQDRGFRGKRIEVRA